MTAPQKKADKWDKVASEVRYYRQLYLDNKTSETLSEWHNSTNRIIELVTGVKKSCGIIVTEAYLEATREAVHDYKKRKAQGLIGEHSQGFFNAADGIAIEKKMTIKTVRSTMHQKFAESQLKLIEAEQIKLRNKKELITENRKSIWDYFRHSRMFSIFSKKTAPKKQENLESISPYQESLASSLARIT
jgi:hypothetical protein